MCTPGKFATLNTGKAEQNLCHEGLRMPELLPLGIYGCRIYVNWVRAAHWKPHPWSKKYELGVELKHRAGDMVDISLGA